MSVPDAAKMTRDPQTDALKRNIAQADPLSALQNLLSAAFSNRPPEANIDLKANPDIENRKQAMQQPLSKQIENSLDPIQLAVLKAIQKKTSEQAVEAIDQRVPPERILGQMGIPTQKTQMNSPTNPVPKERSILGGLIRQTPGQRSIELENAIREQQIRGELPLQKGDIQRLDILQNNATELASQKFANDLALELEKTKDVKALNSADAGKFALVVEGAEAMQNVASLIEENKGVIFSSELPFFLKSQKGRQFNSSLRQAFSARLRFESGGAITEAEIEDKWKTFKPNKTDSEETIRQKLSAMNNFFNRTKNIIDPTGVHFERATQGESKQIKGSPFTIGKFTVEFE